MLARLASLLLLVVAVPAFAGDDVTLTVTNEGTGDKAPLRYAVTAGTKATRKMSMKLDLTTALLGREVPVDVPTIHTMLDAEVTGTEAETFDLRFAYREAKADKAGGLGGMAAKPVVDGLEGATGTLTSTTRGELVDAAVALDVGTDAGSQESFDVRQWVVPLPEAPLGVGATWTAVQKGAAPNGLVMEQTSTYTLTARTKTTATLSVELVQHTEPGTIEADGTKVDIQSMEGKGAGTVTLQFDSPLPAKASLETTVTSTMLLQGMNTTQTAKVVVTIDG